MVGLILIVYGMLASVDCIENTRRQIIEPYLNHSLLQLTPEDKDQLQKLNTLESAVLDVDVLKYSSGVNNSLDVLVPNEKLKAVNDFAKRLKLRVNVKTVSYGKHLEDLIEPVVKLSGKKYFLYHSYKRIQAMYKELAEKNPKLVKIEHLGKSFEGRRIDLVKISKNPKAGNPIIFIDAGIHAREWVAPATAVYFIHMLLIKDNSKDLNGVDYYFIPCTNPDGYEYSRESKRMWRKTRSKRPNSKCHGVDGNRNFDHKWGEVNANTDPCSYATYIGPKPFSEPETQIIKLVFDKYRGRLKMYLTLHCYGQLILYPYGWTSEKKPPNERVLYKLGKAAANAMVSAGSKPFQVMSCAGLYPTTGTGTDYAYANGVPYSIAMELTDGDEFATPEKKLPKILPPFYKGLQVFARHIRREFSDDKMKLKASHSAANKNCMLS